MGLEGFWLFFSSVAAIIKGICVFFNVVDDYRYIKVFKLLVHLGVRAYLAILLRGLYYHNLSLLKEPFCLKATAFYRVFVEFLFRLLQDFKKGIVDINKRYK